MRHPWRFALVAALLALSACSVPEDKVTPGVIEGVPPEKVTGLTAFVDGSNVRLAWNARADADGYQVFRKLTGPAKAILRYEMLAARYRRTAEPAGEKVADVSTVLHVDSPQLGSTYEYRVVAYNEAGEAPPSAAVTASLWVPPPYVDPFASFVHAPYDPTLGGAVGEPFVPPAVIVGGNEGVTATTRFALAEGYASCVSTGVELLSVRPALGSTLPVSDQTFLFTFAYNITRPTDFAWALFAEWPGDDAAIASQYLTLEAGCGVQTFTYTVAVGAYPKGTSVTLGTLTTSGVHFRNFPRVDSSRITIASTWPARGGDLTGEAPLRVSLSYALLPTGAVRAVLRNDDFEFGAAVTAISGTGQMLLDVPYHAACGSDPLRLVVSVERDGVVIAQSYADYRLAIPGAIRLQLPAQQYVDVLDSDQLWEFVGVASCDGTERDVTLYASFGMLENYSNGGYGQKVSGKTGDVWFITALPKDLPTQNFATYPLTITLSADGLTPLAATLDVAAYGLFWKTSPPPFVEGTASFPVEVTAANLPNTAELWLDVEGPVSNRTPLVWNGAGFAGTVTVGTCGFYGISLEGRVGISPLEGPWRYTSVSNSPEYGLRPSDSWLELLRLGEPVVQEVYIEEACGRPITWEVASAPPWVRFSTLSGNSATVLRVLFDVDSGADVGPYGHGEIYLTSPQAPGYAVIDVYFDYF